MFPFTFIHHVSLYFVSFLYFVTASVHAGLSTIQTFYFSFRFGAGFDVLELEQVKETVRMEKVNVALAMLNAQAVAKKENEYKFLKQLFIISEQLQL